MAAPLPDPWLSAYGTDRARRCMRQAIAMPAACGLILPCCAGRSSPLTQPPKLAHAAAPVAARARCCIRQPPLSHAAGVASGTRPEAPLHRRQLLSDHLHPRISDDTQVKKQSSWAYTPLQIPCSAARWSLRARPLPAENLGHVSQSSRILEAHAAAAPVRRRQVQPGALAKSIKTSERGTPFQRRSRPRRRCGAAARPSSSQSPSSCC